MLGVGRYWDSTNHVGKQGPYFSSYFLIDRENTIISRYADSTFLNTVFDFANLADGGDADMNNERYLVNISNAADGDWRLVAFTPYHAITQRLVILQTTITILLVVIAAVLVIFFVLLNINMTRPIGELVETFEAVARGNLKRRVNMTQANEFKVIGDCVNNMLDEIMSLTKNIFNTQQRLYESEIIKQKQQLTSLYQQINSHFFFNTLTTIRAMALTNETTQLVLVLNRLVSILRYCTREAEFTYLSGEIEYLRAYLEIQNKRHGDRFSMIDKIEPRFLECRALKLILQPFIENAIVHGFSKTFGCGEIVLEAHEDDGAVIVKITDNGSGIEEERADWLLNRLKNWREMCESPDGKNIGLLNVQSRLKLFFGDEYGVAFHSKPGETVFIAEILLLVVIFASKIRVRQGARRANNCCYLTDEQRSMMRILQEDSG